MPQLSIKDIYDKIRNTLHDSDVQDADFVARHIIKSKVDIGDINILLNQDLYILQADYQALLDYAERAAAGEPLNRILAESHFWGLRFKVTPDVLDPRNDTETLIDVALKQMLGKAPATILDLGTGTGCLIISLLTEWPLAEGVAVDICPKALAVAQHNAGMNRVEQRLRLVKSSWGETISGKFDLIVSNPPYIRESDIPNLSKSVRNYDPILALSGGKDGLDAYKKIILDIKRLLSAHGKAFLEIGNTQGDEVVRLVRDSGLTCHGVHPDMAGNPRVVEISFGEK